MSVFFLTLQPDGREIGESIAILRFAGKLGGLYPEKPLQALLVDSLVDIAASAINGAPQAKDEAEKKAQREAYADGKLKLLLQGAETFIKTYGSDNFTVGDS